MTAVCGGVKRMSTFFGSHESDCMLHTIYLSCRAYNIEVYISLLFGYFIHMEMDELTHCSRVYAKPGQVTLNCCLHNNMSPYRCCTRRASEPQCYASCRSKFDLSATRVLYCSSNNGWLTITTFVQCYRRN